MPARPRKRVRRRRVSEKFDDSSSDSDPDSGSDSTQSNPSVSKATNNKSSSESTESSSTQSESESSDSSSSSSSSSCSSSNRPTAKRGRLAKKQNLQARAAQQQQAADQATSQTVRRSPSPIARSPPAPLPSSFFDPDLGLPYLDSPPDFALPPDLETKPATRQVDGLQSARLKLAQDEERFRAWYMATIVDRFPNELDQLRASSDPKKSTTSVDLLVAALGSGVDIFDDSIPLPSSSILGFDDRHLVLQTLDLLDKRNHLDPALCPSQPSDSQDIEMCDPVDE